MFGALNRFIARLDGEPAPPQAEQGPSDNSYGFQILKNPTKELPLEPWFDFIIGINGHFIASSDMFMEMNKHADLYKDSPDPNLFATEVRNCAGAYCSLNLWSAKV
jgi:hypothetical protein